MLVLGGEVGRHIGTTATFTFGDARRRTVFELMPTKFLTQNEIDAAKVFAC